MVVKVNLRVWGIPQIDSGYAVIKPVLDSL